MTSSVIPLKELGEQVILERRHRHAHPELGFEEHETARFIAERFF